MRTLPSEIRPTSSDRDAPRRPTGGRIAARLARYAASALVLYLALLAVLMLLEESLIFFPARYPEGDYDPVGLKYEDAWITSADGTRLHGWYVAHPHPRAVVLFAHGNAGNLSHRAAVVQHLNEQLQVSLLIFDYRGYGRSDGKPNEAGILQDARAARTWLARRAGIEADQIVLLGRSLGGAVAIDLAATDGARALVIESTFTSLPEVAAFHYPWAPVRWLMRTRLDSRGKISAYRGPLLQSHGDADQVVPWRFGKALFDAAVSQNKQFVTIPGGDHNDPQPASYYQRLSLWLDDLARDQQ